jgi:hypothetical protein
MSDESQQIDERLRQWARHTAPAADRLLRLRQEIMAQATRPDSTAVSSTGQRWWQTIAGRAAIALIALSLLMVVMLRPRPATVSGPSPSSIALLPEAHLQKLVAEIERLFDDRLAWVAETNDDVLLGIEPSASPAAGGPRVAVRVVVLQRSTPSGPWQAVWMGDVAARAEELVQVDSPGDGSQLKLWTYILPDGAVSVDTELAMPKGGPRTWKSSSVQQPQVPLQLLSNRQGDAEFQVWPTAAVLTEGAL